MSTSDNYNDINSKYNYYKDVSYHAELMQSNDEQLALSSAEWVLANVPAQSQELEVLPALGAPNE